MIMDTPLGPNYSKSDEEYTGNNRARACHASLLAAGFAGLERVVDWWLGPAVRRWARPRLRPLAELRNRQSAVGTIALDSAGGHEKPGVRDTVDLQ